MRGTVSLWGKLQTLWPIVVAMLFFVGMVYAINENVDTNNNNIKQNTEKIDILESDINDVRVQNAEIITRLDIIKESLVEIKYDIKGNTGACR